MHFSTARSTDLIELDEERHASGATKSTPAPVLPTKKLPLEAIASLRTTLLNMGSMRCAWWMSVSSHLHLHADAGAFRSKPSAHAGQASMRPSLVEATSALSRSWGICARALMPMPTELGLALSGATALVACLAGADSNCMGWTSLHMRVDCRGGVCIG